MKQKTKFILSAIGLITLFIIALVVGWFTGTFMGVEYNILD